MTDGRDTEQAWVKEKAQPTVRDQVIQRLQSAVQALQAAHHIAISTHSLAADIPVFQKIHAMQKEISVLMAEVNKLRGL